MHPDPHTPAPITRVEKRRRLSPEAYAGYAAIVLMMLQPVFWLRDVFALNRMGAVSVAYTMTAVLSVALVALGGILFVAGARAATYVLALAALFSTLTFLQWRSPYPITYAAMAAFACIVSAYRSKSRD